MLLHGIAATDRRVKVIFDDGTRGDLTKLIIPGAKPPSDDGVAMSFCWEEIDDAILWWEKCVRWVRRKPNRDLST
jgi:hypothetical protein